MDPNSPIPVLPSDPLPPCGYRGQLVTMPTGKARLECSHPKMLSGGDKGLVPTQMCHECKYSVWEPESAQSQYSQRNQAMPTPDEYAFRVQSCNICGKRSGNYCTLVGTCSLARILQRPGTTCPIGKFTAILPRQIMTDTAPTNESPEQVARRNARIARESRRDHQKAVQQAVVADVRADKFRDEHFAGPQGAELADVLAAESPIDLGSDQD